MAIKWISLGIACFALLLGLIFGFFILIMSMLKGDVYNQSLKLLNSNEVIREEIGHPVKPSYFVMGSTNTSGASGHTELEYSIHGSIASGKAFVYANKHAGRWTIEEFIVSNTLNGERYILVERN